MTTLQSAPSSAAAAATSKASHPWLAVLSVALSAAVFVTAEFLPVGLLRFISVDMGISEGTAGLLVTLPGLLAAFAALIVTVAVRDLDRRRVLLWLGALLVVSNIVAIAAPNFAVLLVARVLFGVGLGAFWATGASLGGRLVAEKYAAKATAIIFSGISAGMLIGGAAGALIGELAGWRLAFTFGLVISIVSLLALWFFVPALPTHKRVQIRDLLSIVTTRNARVGLITMAFVLTAQFATYTYITPFLAQVSGLGGKLISSLLLGYTLVGIFGNFAGGALAERNIKATLSAAILMFIGSVALLPVVAGSTVGVVLVLAIWGIAYGALPVVQQMWIMGSSPDAREGGTALLVANFQVAIAAGAFFGGEVVDRLGLANSMYFGGAIATIGLLIFWMFSAAKKAAPAIVASPAKA